MTTEFLSRAGGPLRGSIEVPGDKSISHRALMLGAIADGDTVVEGFLAGEDTEATLAAFRAMGVTIDRHSPTRLVVRGAGLDGLVAPQKSLDLGNSGTSMRLLAGLLCGQKFGCEMVGDDSLMRRPMRRVTRPLKLMGADIECAKEGTPPVRIRPVAGLTGISCDLDVASAQLKSALLFAGLHATGTTCVREPAVTRDHTERMLGAFGARITREKGQVCVRAGRLKATEVRIPGDISSAAFFLVAAALVGGSDLVIRNVGVNPTRAAVLDILRAMGARIDCDNARELSGEPVADVRVRHAPLHGIRIPRELVSIAIDEFPAILVAAAGASGETVLEGASELRVKESDRIAAMAEGFLGLGVEAHPAADGMRVVGGGLTGGEVESRGDHRIAMAFAVAGLIAREPVRIRDCANVNTSFPGFAHLLRLAGGHVEERTIS